jgi:molecular chaperone GrpE
MNRSSSKSQEHAHAAHKSASAHPAEHAGVAVDAEPMDLNADAASLAAEAEAIAASESENVAELKDASQPGELERLLVELEQAKAERAQLLDRLARLQAEFDNARKREVRERTEFRDYALVNTVEQFLPVLDNFQLALRAQGSAEQLRTGVELIVRQMEEILRTLGVQAVPTQDAVFDPRVHEALEMVEREDVPDHQVLEEVRRGYTLRERLLRPALVRVASNARQHTA